VTRIPPAREQEERLRAAWLWRQAGKFLGYYIRFVVRTTRFTGTIPQDQVIFVFWHEANLAVVSVLYGLLRTRRMVTFSTQGRRGMVVNAMAESMGATIVALPDRAGRGEAAGLARDLIDAARGGLPVGVSCDGPWGPYRVTKPGPVIVARAAGLPIVPVAVALRPAWRLNRRWDRQLVPLPFGRMQVILGERWTIDSHDRLRPTVERLQRSLDEVAADADRSMAVG
jgi:lysophospholipid acyltransferase (LPLAT)-like uncharacterized protein